MAVTRQLTPRGAERRDQLEAIATTLFAAHGYHGTSVSNIVRACGVGKGVFYWYFPSKDHLFRAIINGGFLQLRRAQRRAIEGEDDPVVRIVQGIRATLDFLAANEDLFRLFEFASVEQAYQAEYTRAIEVAVSDTNRHIEAAIGAGLISVPDASYGHYMAHGITTVTMNFFRQFMALDAPERRARHEDVVEAAVDFCLHGIRTNQEAGVSS